ncbi:MAG TPA: hypothetical protein DDY90_07340 [Clostridiales bacterium]|nr:hypothetical protein [Clostridiales bacterium]
MFAEKKAQLKWYGCNGEAMSKRVIISFRRFVAACLLLTIILACLPGCGRRAGANRRISIKSRRGSISAAETSPEYATEEPTDFSAETPPQYTVDQAYTAEVPAETADASSGPLLYGDSRVPDYDPIDPQWETIRFDWECQNGVSTAWAEISVDANMYSYYRSLGRYYSVDMYYHYINDENNRALVQGLVDALRDVAKGLHYDAGAVAREIAMFVQSCIEYRSDMETAGQEDYPKYPIETLYERQGDCEDTSILMAAMLKEFGYEVGFLLLPSHVAVALRTTDDYQGSAYYQIGDKRYLYIESTTSGWKIGDIPEEYANVQAEFYLVP